MFSCEFREISKNTFLHKTPMVAASEDIYNRGFAWFLMKKYGKLDFQLGWLILVDAVVVTRKCSVKKVFLEISRNS